MGDLANEQEAEIDPGVLALRAEIAKDLEDGESGESINETSEGFEEEAPGAHVPEERQPPAPVAVVADTEDSWAGVNPALKVAFDNMTEQVTAFGAATTRVKQLESRVGSITNELHAAKAAAVTAKEAPTDQEMAAATESNEAWEKLKIDFPEWSMAIDGRINSIKGGGGAEVEALKTEIQSIKTDLAGKASEADIEERVAESVMSYAHPKWKETIASPDYAAWLAIQKPEFITLAETSTDFLDAISVLDAYSASKGTVVRTASEIAAARSDRLIASTLPDGGKLDAPKSEADMSEEELRAQIGKEVWAED